MKLTIVDENVLGIIFSGPRRMAIRREIVITSSKGETMRIQAVAQLEADQMLWIAPDTLVLGRKVYWKWYEFLATLKGNEDIFFKHKQRLIEEKQKALTDGK